MLQQKSRYEEAFETYLRVGDVRYVDVDEARRASGEGWTARAGLKSFDAMICRGSGGYLVEVKGRRGDSLATWVTRDDVESLLQWEQLFGANFESLLVFVYDWGDQPPDGAFCEQIRVLGKWYGLAGIRVREYAREMRTRSRRWGTVDITREALRRLSLPLGWALGGTASCAGRGGSGCVRSQNEGGARRANVVGCGDEDSYVHVGGGGVLRHGDAGCAGSGPARRRTDDSAATRSREA